MALLALALDGALSCGGPLRQRQPLCGSPCAALGMAVLVGKVSITAQALGILADREQVTGPARLAGGEAKEVRRDTHRAPEVVRVGRTRHLGDDLLELGHHGGRALLLPAALAVLGDVGQAVFDERASRTTSGDGLVDGSRADHLVGHRQLAGIAHALVVDAPAQRRVGQRPQGHGVLDALVAHVLGTQSEADLADSLAIDAVDSLECCQGAGVSALALQARTALEGNRQLWCHVLGQALAAAHAPHGGRQRERRKRRRHQPSSGGVHDAQAPSPSRLASRATSALIRSITPCARSA